MVGKELKKDLRDIVVDYMQQNVIGRFDSDYAHDIMREELGEAMQAAIEQELQNI